MKTGGGASFWVDDYLKALWNIYKIAHYLDLFFTPATGIAPFQGIHGTIVHVKFRRTSGH